MSDAKKAPAVLHALMQMKKLDIATLKHAYEQAGADERGLKNLRRFIAGGSWALRT